MVSVSMFHVIILYRYKIVKLLESPSRNGLQTRCRSSVDFQIWRPLSTITQDLSGWQRSELRYMYQIWSSRVCQLEGTECLKVVIDVV